MHHTVTNRIRRAVARLRDFLGYWPELGPVLMTLGSVVGGFFVVQWLVVLIARGLS